MKPELYPHQKEAIEKLKTGSILCGGVGTGKSLTAVGYFFKRCKGIWCDGEPFLDEPMDLYIITTARKRDTLEWDKECLRFHLSTRRDLSIDGCKVTVDSWNNIRKYEEVENAFFIFDEQRVVGSGAWVKSFLKITKHNEWILLSATPGDTWMDYVPVFIANGFFKNKTEFLRNHVIFNRFVKYPKVDRYIETGKLLKMKNSILVNMPYMKTTQKYVINVNVDYDAELLDIAWKQRWNPFYSEPLMDAGALCQISRRIVNSDLSRLDEIKKILEKKKKVIIFYNFDHELAILRTLSKDIFIAEWNGHKHEPIPDTDRWVYLVQYTAGAEGWNCIETDTIIFYSQNYSYKTMLQASGRIDRMNTPFKDLYYYVLKSKSPVDLAISKALKNKKDFNELRFYSKMLPEE